MSLELLCQPRRSQKEPLPAHRLHRPRARQRAQQTGSLHSPGSLTSGGLQQTPRLDPKTCF